MPNSIESLLATGTKLWLDSVDPELVRSNRAAGATGATSNPIIVADLMATGRFDAEIARLVRQGLDDCRNRLADDRRAWSATPSRCFCPSGNKPEGNDGYVSFELDPLLEDPELNMPHAKRVAEYVRLGTAVVRGPQEPDDQGAGHAGRPGRPGRTGCRRGDGQRDAGLFVASVSGWPARPCGAGRRRRKSLDGFKSVYSIFVSRLDVYTEKAVPQLSPAAQGMVGILNAKRIWAENQQFWAERSTPLAAGDRFRQHGHEETGDPPWKYVEAFAGSDIETNPPATNEAVAQSGRTFARQVDQLPRRPWSRRSTDWSTWRSSKRR